MNMLKLLKLIVLVRVNNNFSTRDSLCKFKFFFKIKFNFLMPWLLDSILLNDSM